MSLNKTLTVGEQRQLVELNGGIQEPNFDLTFTIESTKGESFEVVIIDQKTLDTDPNLKFKLVDNGKISGNIIADQNVPQSYLLCLKSTKPCQVNLKTVFKPLPYNPNANRSTNVTNTPNTTNTPNILNGSNPYTSHVPNHKNNQLLNSPEISFTGRTKKTKHSFLNMKNIIIILVVLGCVWFIWSTVSKKKGNKEEKVGAGFSKKSNHTPYKINSASSASSVASSNSSGSSSSSIVSRSSNRSLGSSSSSIMMNKTSGKINHSLLNRLNNLPIR